MRTLDLSRPEATKRLSRWAQQGWLRRVAKGAYVTVALDLLGSENILEDPWLLVPLLFSPAYIGGRSGAEHWDLTEQIFRDILVFTGQKVRSKNQHIQGVDFTLKHIREENIFGTKSVWRGQTKIQVSDIHRTIIDIVNDPSIGGGIQHVEDCFHSYLKRPDFDLHKLIEYGQRLGNGAIFKRLGFLAERHHLGEPLIPFCQAHLTKGNAKLDTSLDCDRLVTKWRLWVPDIWLKGNIND